MPEQTTEEQKHKRILFVITLGELGGAQKYVRDLSMRLKREYNISIASSSDDDTLLEWAKKEGLTTIALPFLSRRLWKGLLPTRGDWITLWNFYKLFRDNSYDVVHLNSSKIGFLGAISGKFAGIPKIIFTAHGWVFNEPNSIRGKRVFWVLLSKLAARFQDHIICVSDYDFNRAIQYHVAPPRKLITIYNGLDYTKVRFASRERARKWLKTKTGINKETPVVGTIANFYPTKDLGALIKALKNLPDEVRLVIMGDGPERKILESQVISYELQDRVFLLGSIADGWQWLRAFDVYVISSLKEGLPFSALEAMAAGVPIVSTPAGGLRELFFAEDKCPAALEVTFGNPQKLAEGIQKLLSDKELAKTLTKNAERALKKRFTLDEMVAKTKWVWDF